jgi:hypothetical protein
MSAAVTCENLGKTFPGGVEAVTSVSLDVVLVALGLYLSARSLRVQ